LPNVDKFNFMLVWRENMTELV